MEESVKLFSSSQHLEMAQVGHFNNKVVYARAMDERGWLDRLWKSLRHGCQSAGIPLIDGDTFTPHVTILKLSRDRLLYRKVIVQPRGKKKKNFFIFAHFPRGSRLWLRICTKVTWNAYSADRYNTIGKYFFYIRKNNSRSYTGDRECWAAVDDIDDER